MHIDISQLSSASTSPSYEADATLLNKLADDLYGAGDKSRKPTIYLNEYARWFGAARNAPLRIFELGVQRGVSMLLWEKFFPNATVVGLDGDPQPDIFPKSPRFHFVRAWQDEATALDKAVELAGGPFDIIIDDASHLGCHTGRSFAGLFPSGLRPGGIYVIEDLCTAFGWPNDYDAARYVPPEIGIPGMPRTFPSHEWGMIGLIKQLLDHAMAPTALGDYTRYDIARMTVLTNIALLQKASQKANT